MPKTRTVPKTTLSYYDNYQTLKTIAEKMRQQQAEPNIDELIPLVEQATEAYKNCQARIAAVEQALGLTAERQSESADDAQSTV